MSALKKITTENIPKIAEIHLNAFPDFFLTSLGSEFLKTYYSSVLTHPTGIGICIIKADIIIGFAVGTSLSKGFHKKILLNNLFSFSFHLLRILVNKPASIIRLLFNLEKKTSVAIPSSTAELLSIGIDPKYKGQGLGKMLLEEFEKVAKQKQSTAAILTTDFYKNESTIKFYEKCGYSILCDFVTYPKRKMYKMIKQL